MCSFRGTYANRGNGTELSSSDVVHQESPAPPVGPGILGVGDPALDRAAEGSFLRRRAFETQALDSNRHVFP